MRALPTRLVIHLADQESTSGYGPQTPIKSGPYEWKRGRTTVLHTWPPKLCINLGRMLVGVSLERDG